MNRARFNLTSTSARANLAKELNVRAESLDWQGMLEQACVKILDKHREGEPLVQLSEHRISERLPFRVVPVLQEKQSSVFYGHGDSGKSYFAAYLAVLVATGLAQNGFTPEPGNVLILDFETDEDTQADRVRKIANGLGISFPSNIYYRYNHQPIAADIETVQRHVLEKDIALVIVDSAAPAVGEPESAQMVTAYFSALRSLKATNATIAHLTKNGKEDAPFGSVFWRNLPRASFRVNASHDPGAGGYVHHRPQEYQEQQ